MTYGVALGLHSWYPPLDPILAARASIEWMRLMVGIDAEVGNDSGAPMLALRPLIRRGARSPVGSGQPRGWAGIGTVWLPLFSVPSPESP
jgi:hypothetical protein